MKSLDHHLTTRCMDLQNALTKLEHEHMLLVSHLYQIAEALGVPEEGYGVTPKGIAPSRILEKIQELKNESTLH